MAIVQDTYTGNGSTTIYSLSFPYLEETDVVITLNGTVTTAYTFPTSNTIQFTTAPGNGVVIKITRNTELEQTDAKFYPGSTIRAEDLNDNFTQLLYVAQEADYNVDTANTTANTALTNANTAVSTANTASTNASNAVTTANTASANASAAVSTANTASTNASNAVTTANNAVTTANAATATANTASTNASNAVATANAANTNANQANVNASAAVSTANTASTNATAAVNTANTAATNASNAVTTANSAVTTANTAVSVSNNAVTASNTAVTTANAAAAAVASAILYTIVANVAAIPASPANNDAVEVTDSTGIESFTPLSGIPAGFVGSSGLSVRIVYQSAGSTWTWIQYFPNDPEARYLKLSGGTLTGQLKGDDSTSASTPGFAFDGDANTGMGRPGADELALITDGTARLTIDSAGAVSIPGTLGVTGAVTGTSTVSGSALIPTGSSVPSNGVYLPSANNVAISTNGSNRLHIASDGNIGVGMTSPAHQLVVGQNAWIGTGGGGNTGAGTSRTLTIGVNRTATDVSPSIQLLKAYTSATASAGGFKIDLPNSGVASPELAFYSGTSTGNSAASFVEPTWSERLRITSTGLVGIGTSSPSSLLHLQGSAAQAITVTRTSSISSAGDPYGYIDFIGENNLGSGPPDYSARIIAAHDSALGANIRGSTLSFYTQFSSSNASEKMRIDSSGRVGVGTTSPQALLDLSANNETGSNTLRFSDTDTLTVANQQIGKIEFYSADASTPGASVKAYIGAFSEDTSPDAYLAFATDTSTGTPVERLRITSAGNVGVGTTAPNSLLELAGVAAPTLRLTSSSGPYSYLESNTVGSVGIAADESNTGASTNINFRVDGTERARIDSSGRLLVGTSSSISTANGFTPSVQVAGASTLAAISAGRYAANANPPQFALQKSRNATIGSHTVVNSGDEVGGISFEGSDGSAFIQAALITAAVDGTPGSNDMPGRLVLSTTADGASSPTERMRITSSGTYFATAPNGSTLYPAFWCRAWVNFNGTGTVAIRASGNVSSITDNGTGSYTVNFTTTMPDTNYCTVATSNINATGSTNRVVSAPYAASPTVSALGLSCTRADTVTLEDHAFINVAIFR
jgi:hypothetical protein